MTPHAITVSPTTPIRRAADLMRGHSIGCLVVVTGAQVVGIVTVADLAELMDLGCDRPAPTSRRRAIHHRVPHQKRHGASSAS
jgi:CBS domain-containing protein